MAGNTPGERLVRGWGWLAPFDKVLGAMVSGLYRIPGTGPLKTLLHGTWPLRHPLHPLITDVTVGGYTMLVILDLLYLVRRDASLVTAADTVFVLTYVSSVISALSGLTDWNETSGRDRRVGVAHGLIMVVSTIGFLVALIWRVFGDPAARDIAIYLGFASYLFLAVGAWFGGELPFGLGVGVQRLAWRERVSEWEALDLAASPLEDREPAVGRTKRGLAIMVTKIDDAIYAIGNTCTHRACDLNKGKIVGSARDEVECDCHRSVFSIRTGQVKRGPATSSEASFDVRVNSDGKVEVRSR